MERKNDLTLLVGRAIELVGETWLRQNETRTDGKHFEVGYTDRESVRGTDEDRILGSFEQRHEAESFRRDVVALRVGQAALSAIEDSGYVVRPVEKPLLLDGIPVDHPRFDDREAVNDWRCEVGARTAAIWADLTTPQRLAVAQDAQIVFAKSQQGQDR